MIIAVEDKSYRCKDCDSFGQCEYYNNRRPTSHICKEFTNDIKVAEILDKIRAEIEKLQKMCDKNDLNLMAQYSAFGMVLDIIDKHKGVSE